ncbi:MAG: hypothetical protein QOJ79_3435 [Actinomycetota bacterium]|nr:hypothetical protein [Actinomycetota bacterium]
MTTPQLHTGNLRRLAQEGVLGGDVDRGVQVVVKALGEGPQTRSQLRARLESAGVPVAGQALVHVLMRTCLALTELALRYLRGHGPARDRDLATWAGMAVGDARRGLSGVRGLPERADGTVSLTKASQPAMPRPRLLGPFDPLLLGWADRSPVVGPHGSLVTSNGVFRAFALVEGRAVATWSAAGGLDLLEQIDAATAAALDADLAGVPRFFGSARYR